MMTICNGRCNMLLRPGMIEDRSLDPYVAEDMANRFTEAVISADAPFHNANVMSDRC